jgi:hypothetical protein
MTSIQPLTTRKNSTLAIPQLLPQRANNEHRARHQEDACADEHDLDHVKQQLKIDHDQPPSTPVTHPHFSFSATFAANCKHVVKPSSLVWVKVPTTRPFKRNSYKCGPNMRLLLSTFTISTTALSTYPA